MTPTQRNMLAHLDSLPARYRLAGRAGGPIRPEVLESYDGRAWRGLFKRGYLVWGERGFTVVKPPA